jgi:hypothetical protein
VPSALARRDDLRKRAPPSREAEVLEGGQCAGARHRCASPDGHGNDHQRGQGLRARGEASRRPRSLPGVPGGATPRRVSALDWSWTRSSVSADGKEGHAAVQRQHRDRAAARRRLPERWFEGYLETRSRSEGYPGPDTRDDHLYRTRTKEEVGARVTRSEAPSVLEEDQEGKTFSRHVRYRLTPSPVGTSLRVDDDVSFKGLGKLAAPLAARDIKKRWETSLEKLKATAESGQ